MPTKQAKVSNNEEEKKLPNLNMDKHPGVKKGGLIAGKVTVSIYIYQGPADENIEFQGKTNK